MVTRYTTFVALLFAASTGACSADAPVSTPVATTTPSTPTLVNANTLVSAIAGSAFSYDATRGGTTFADPAGKGLTYSVSFSGVSTGLTAVAGVIGGTPASPGVVTVTVTATDALGRQVTDQFRIVSFAPGLASPALPATPLRYADAEVPFPAHFTSAVNGTVVTSTDNTPADNAITDAGATLGRVLFYDPRLSANDGTSCASCHLQASGFGDTPALSVGFQGGFTGRHTSGITNARFYARKKFFWDERAATLEDQVLQPVQNATEMGSTLDAVVTKLLATPFYGALFSSAFGSATITSDRIARALAQYTRSMVSTTSRYDKAFTGGVPNFAATFTAQEQLGEQLFRTTGCAACHTTTSQVSDSVHNIGLDAGFPDVGAGSGAFKAPSLRNVAVRGTFMHDGRFTSLEQVIDFFDSGVQANPALDARLKAADGSPKRLGLSATQKSALVAFLGTLTDSAFLADVRFSNPFSLATVIAAPPVNASAAVTIQGKAYHPPTLAVSAGTVVTWTNLDNTRHSAQFDDPTIVSTPIFSTGSRTVTMPAKPGTYTYHCAVHGNQMLGSVTVK